MPFLVHGRSETHLIPWWYWGLRVRTQTASRSIQSFFCGLTLLTLQQTDTYTDHATCVAVDRIPCYEVWCDLKVTMQHLARLARPTSVMCIVMLFGLRCWFCSDSGWTIYSPVYTIPSGLTTVHDSGPTCMSDRPRYHTHTRQNLSLPLAWAKPHRSPRYDSWWLHNGNLLLRPLVSTHRTP